MSDFTVNLNEGFADEESEVIRIALLRVVEDALPKIVDNTPYITGLLAGSMTVFDVSDVDAVRVEIGSYGVDYAAPVEAVRHMIENGVNTTLENLDEYLHNARAEANR